MLDNNKGVVMRKVMVLAVVSFVASWFLPGIDSALAKNPYRAVEMNDADGDGRMNFSEFGKPRKVFGKFDADGDGFVTPEEVAKKWGVPLPPKPTGDAPKRTAAEAGTLDESQTIIADVHMHPHPANHPVDVLTWMNRNGVKWAGLGSLGGGRKVREFYAEIMGYRYISFGGQDQLNRIYSEGGSEALEDSENPKFKAMMEMLKRDFEAGKLKGIGEIFANSNTTSKFWMGRKMKIDAPTNRAIFDLATKFGGVLNMHMQWDSDSVEQLQALAASNPSGKIIMAHCGSNTTANNIREIMWKHQNIFCDLSARHPPKLSPKLMEKKPEQVVFTESGLSDSWRELIEEMPDRFMVGTDTESEDDYDGGIGTIRSGLLANLKPETAEKVAYKNAQQLLRLQ